VDSVTRAEQYPIEVTEVSKEKKLEQDENKADTSDERFLLINPVTWANVSGYLNVSLSTTYLFFGCNLMGAFI